MSTHPDMPRNPFVGLRPFESDEALLFFGRREQTVELLQQLHLNRFLAVVGSSGCGKSSLIRAGLIPKLKAGMLVEDRDRWFIATMKPGDLPRQNLAVALSKALPKEQRTMDAKMFNEAIQESGITPILEMFGPALNKADANLLLLVDQFEEIFRFGLQADDEARKEETADAVSLMLALAEQRDLPIYVVITMRSEFLGDCDAFYGLPEALNRSQYLVPRLTRGQRREAIEGPIRLYGRTIAPRLLDRLLNDAGDKSDQLPLLEHVLMRIWENWQQNPESALDLNHYEAIGTIKEALSRHAEEALEGLDKDGLKLTEHLFRALTQIDHNNRRIRRPAHLSEIEAISGKSRGRITEIIERFRSGGRSFLVVSEESLSVNPLIDISHETLIRQWKRLREWTDKEEEDHTTFDRIVDAAKRHVDKEGDVLHGLDLDLALKWSKKSQPTEAWAQRYHPKLAFEQAMTFLTKSVKLRWFKRAFTFAVALTVAVLVTIERIKEAQKANYKLAKVYEGIAGDALVDARRSRSNEDYKIAWLYTLAALNQNIGPDKRLPISLGTLLLPEIRSRTFRENWISPTSIGDILSVAFSPDGKRLASGVGDNSIRLWDVDTGEEVAVLAGHIGPVETVAFSPDGKRLASASGDNSIRLWDVDTGEEVAVLQGHSSEVYSIAFSPDGKRLASGVGDNSIRLWDVDTGQEVAVLAGHIGPVETVAFSPNGKRLASGSGDNSIRLWDVDTGEEVAVLQGHVKKWHFYRDMRVM